MADYIRRDIVLQIINTAQNTGSFVGYADYSTVFDEIDTMPAADVKRVKRGWWQLLHHEYGIKYYCCSECNKNEVRKYNYCPNCGAKMNEAELIKG